MAREPGGPESQRAKGPEGQRARRARWRERESNSPNLKKDPAKICPAAEPTETGVGKGWAHIWKRAPKTGWKVEASATIEDFTSACSH